MCGNSMRGPELATERPAVRPAPSRATKSLPRAAPAMYESAARRPRRCEMPDILQDFPIAAPPARVYAAVSEPALLDQWWTLRSSGRPLVGTRYTLDFGPQYLWEGEVTAAAPGRAFEWRITQADADWTG